MPTQPITSLKAYLRFSKASSCFALLSTEAGCGVPDLELLVSLLDRCMALLRNPYPNSKSHGEEATSLYTGAMDETVAEIVRLCPRALSILRNPLNIGAVRRARCNLMRGLTRHRPTHPRRRRPWAAQSVSSCVRVFHLERRFALT